MVLPRSHPPEKSFDRNAQPIDEPAIPENDFSVNLFGASQALLQCTRPEDGLSFRTNWGFADMLSGTSFVEIDFKLGLTRQIVGESPMS
ncbi:hypothetical protein [Bradyrhizobium sp. ARR65]|uniref:hypothetical protein n=1 Tax=Bradyrhizobium sp. ARR65 TaxID=1040989 RepID=UPI0004644D9B|nr:hypothetical protein [Bradyrhizobium sp. ARR65]